MEEKTGLLEGMLVLSKDSKGSLKPVDVFFTNEECTTNMQQDSEQNLTTESNEETKI
ncbi:TPA_asm: hypothetical protein GZU98_14975 [Listeria monocytogenes]|uniref:hypothetical protein n=1 Tax=Listeria monocytogenes TaxID=1639 RepID=UPI001358A9CD|nr:hypothetical protein [Listeria monocytogenes]EGH5564235.1 hypothetical protein [Listeria monocytogenes]EGT8096000.1 hypothetical protein [Listeria monocytogenes]EHG8229715.1 hypothetical protein [Listeria monocytogenes]EHN3750586.1 hypothetical protein [Listeria monocytogenes]EIK0851319.1 hypothetical protein [Listeria monocytogenes]